MDHKILKINCRGEIIEVSDFEIDSVGLFQNFKYVFSSVCFCRPVYFKKKKKELIGYSDSVYFLFHNV